MFGLQHAPTVVHVFPEQRFRLVGLPKVPEDRAQPFLRIKRVRIVGTKCPASRFQVASRAILGQGALTRSIEQQCQKIGGANRVAVPGSVKLGIEPHGGLDVDRSLIVSAQER